MVNRSRQKGRPVEPKTFQCPIVPSYVDVPADFLLSDIKIEDNEGKLEARHLILASANQLAYLKRAACRYVDGTFKSADDNLFKQEQVFDLCLLEM